MSDLQTQPADRSNRRIGLLIVLVVLLALVGFIGVRAFRAATSARAALQEVRALQGLDRDALSSLDPAALSLLRDRFARLETDLMNVGTQAGPFLAISKGLGWLPGIGAEAAAAPELLQLGQQTATAGRAALDGALVVLEASQAGGEDSTLTRVTAALQASEPDWAVAETALNNVATIRDGLDISTLDPRIAGALAQLDTYLPLLRTAVSLGKVAPALMGADEPRTYLLLAQNSEELRPTGGFISGVGLITIDGGDLGDMDFSDSYTVFNPDVDHPLAPPDLERTMGAQILVFRDSNWSADYPAAASVAQSLYQLDTGTATDGVFAFDIEATRRLIGAMEPLALPGYDEPVTSQNLAAAMREVWAAPVDIETTVVDRETSQWWRHRKDFMGDLAAAARAKVEAGEVDFGALAQAVYSSLQEKHILLSVNDPATMALLRDSGWAGAVDPGEADYLFVVDSNVGWNKVNTLVDRSTRYTVRPLADGSAEAELRLAYTHGGQAIEGPCVQEVHYGDTYEDLRRYCYFNYLRVYVPDGAQLLDAQGFEPDSVDQAFGEAGSTVFSGFVVTPSGGEHEVTLRYRLPASVFQDGLYRLRIQKQAGVPAWPVEIAIDDPAGNWQLVEGDARTSEDGLSATLRLATDTDLAFRKGAAQ
ncbi:MAG: DUF4012 domain-containing protein [Anaerolineae bacterium]|nr:DUF4012 domain-containing protein [Anaerolineae bacterium]